ncbi:MAG: DUF1638 domain-containing protein [Desulfarculaceae bacterium]|nr:DUF1638 domain-containing protein [Desulfarculaceae bacterium]
MTSLAPGHRVLACRVFQPELAFLGVGEDQAVYLDQGLHRYPDQLRQTVGASLREIEQDPTVSRVLLAYGYCGGGLQGLCSQRVELLAPLAHDCVPVLLGEKLADPCVGCGGSFFLTPGWIDHGQTPYSEYFVSKQKFGHEDALWIGQEMLAGYDEVVLADTGVGLEPRHHGYSQAMASLFGLAHREARGSLAWLERLLAGEPGPGLALLPPGQPVELNLYPNTESLPARERA